MGMKTQHFPVCCASRGDEKETATHFMRTIDGCFRVQKEAHSASTPTNFFGSDVTFEENKENATSFLLKDSIGTLPLLNDLHVDPDLFDCSAVFR